MIASVAACLFALVIIVPVYLLTGSGRKNEKAMDLAPQMVENVTIQNLVVDASESEMADSEAEPAKEVADGTTEIEVASEMMEEEFSPSEDFTAQSVTGIEEADAAAMSDSSEKGGQLAGPQESGEDEATMNMLQEGETVQQEEMMVTVLGEGELFGILGFDLGLSIRKLTGKKTGSKKRKGSGNGKTFQHFLLLSYCLIYENHFF